MHPTHLPVIPEVGTPANVLRNAARYLQHNGWTQHTYFCGRHPLAWPSACALGAIGVVAHGRPVRTPEDPDLPGWQNFHDAHNALWDYLDVADDTWHDLTDPSVGYWNDQPTMTADRVIAALNNAADRWEHLTSGGAA